MRRIECGGWNPPDIVKNSGKTLPSIHLNKVVFRLAALYDVQAENEYLATQEKQGEWQSPFARPEGFLWR